MNFPDEVERLKRKQKTRLKARSSKSKLDRHYDALNGLAQSGASLAQLQLWLAENRTRASRSTIHRWLKKNQIRTPS